MPIQFHCPACRQPIEVDDDAANQSVACPYCQKVVTAPASSEPNVGQSAMAPSQGAISSPIGPPAPPAPTGNKLAWASLICAMLCIASGVLMNVLGWMVVGGSSGESLTPAEIQKKMLEAIRTRPGYAVAWYASMVGMCAAPVVGVILGGLALAAKRPPRWPAVLSLVVFAVIIVIVCLGVVSQLNQRSAAGGG